MNSTEAPVPTHFLCSEEGVLQNIKPNQIEKKLSVFINFKKPFKKDLYATKNITLSYVIQ